MHLSLSKNLVAPQGIIQLEGAELQFSHEKEHN